MSYLETVHEAARSLALLDASGQLIELDSLEVVDLVTELEQSLSIEIPADDMRAETFKSLESVTRMIERIKG